MRVSFYEWIFLDMCAWCCTHTTNRFPSRNCSKRTHNHWQYTDIPRGRENGDWRTRIRPIRNDYGYHSIHLNLWNVFERNLLFVVEGKEAFHAAARNWKKKRMKTTKQHQITLVAPTCKLSHVKCALIRVYINWHASNIFSWYCCRD